MLASAPSGARVAERPVNSSSLGSGVGSARVTLTAPNSDGRWGSVPTAKLVAGRYQLEAPLGRGAFGEVWRARDVTTGRHAAVKIIDLGAIADAPLLAEIIARFRREVNTIGQLRHPNIVVPYEAGRVANELFLAMELIAGAPLSEVIAQRKAAGAGLLPIPSVLDVADQICAGLAAAHAAGVVHRDVKPSNLMVTPRLQVKIIDFGLARLMADKSPRLTKPSVRLGTPAYMSPEQASGAEIDCRADLYSLGCVLYELLAGEQPFTAETPEELLAMQLRSRPVPIGICRIDLPTALEQLIGELMEKDRESRPADSELVRTRISAMRGVSVPREPVHEADRSTVHAVGQAQSARPTATIARTMIITGPNRDRVGRHRRLTAEAAPAVLLTPAATRELTRPRGLTAEGGAATLRGTAVLPDTRWPTPPPRPRKRRRWRAAVSALITAAILGAAGVIFWQRTHDHLNVTAVAVAPAHLPGSQCNVTVNVVGTITTNGLGGTVSYQWIRGGGLTSRINAVTAARGHATVQVVLQWSFHGSGTYHAAARLRVLTPDVTSAQTAFTYSCAGPRI
jgi:hypothetical protein